VHRYVDRNRSKTFHATLQTGAARIVRVATTELGREMHADGIDAIARDPKRLELER
jgi:hypothetical protein